MSAKDERKLQRAIEKRDEKTMRKFLDPIAAMGPEGARYAWGLCAGRISWLAVEYYTMFQSDDYKRDLDQYEQSLKRRAATMQPDPQEPKHTAETWQPIILGRPRNWKLDYWTRGLF